MKDKENKPMTREEANSLLTQGLMALAKNAVQNKQLLDYIESLQSYLNQLDREENDNETEQLN